MMLADMAAVFNATGTRTAESGTATLGCPAVVAGGGFVPQSSQAASPTQHAESDTIAILFIASPDADEQRYVDETRLATQYKPRSTLGLQPGAFLFAIAP
jgi:hypothetical protein